MTSRFPSALVLVGLLLAASAPAAPAATPKEIDQAIKSGTAALKGIYTRAAGAPSGYSDAGYGLGATCLTGLALLEAGVPANDPAVKTITGLVRDAAYRQNSTYQVALCLMYLDRFGDPADALLIQILGVRLLVGQTAAGGWGYTCCVMVSGDDEKWLRALRGAPPAGKLHADVEKYGQALTAARGANGAGGDDNSNTQFGVLATWMARKHGVPVEAALEAIEKRFMLSQDGRSGNWSYSGPAPGAGAAGAAVMPGGSPSMYCAGLLGMATAVARREEKRKPEPPKPKIDPKADGKPADPFYNPPAPVAAQPKNPPPARVTDERDRTVQRAFAGLGLTLADQIRAGRGLLGGGNAGGHGHFDLYFLWSMERVGVIYGVDKIGGFDWYDVGSTAIVRSQGNDGTWTVSGYGAEVNTAFAVLFLSRSNLARDLSGKVQKDPTTTEMRAGAGPAATDVLPGRVPGPAAPAVPVINLPNPTGDAGIALAAKLLKAPDTDWPKLLIATRDAKGPTNTKALMVTATHADGDRKKAAREALAERLCRMSETTLRAMLKAEDVELRRGAALACAMKDEKGHIPDLIGAIQDPDDAVVRAAKAGLKSLTGKDFGPVAGGVALSAEQKAQAAAAWRDWYAKEKK